MLNKISCFSVLYILSIFVSYTANFFGYRQLYLKIFISLAWILYFFVCNNSSKKFIYKRYLFFLILPCLFAILHSYIIFLAGFNDDFVFRNLTRQISALLTLFCAYSLSVIGLYYFKQKIILYIFIGTSLSYICFCIFPSLLNGDLLLFVRGLFSGEIRESLYLESHDLIFAFGVFITYLILFNRKNNIFKIIALFIFIILGWKRIEFIAIPCSILLFYVALKRNHTNTKSFIIAFSMLFISLVFVWSVKDGMFFSLVNKLGFNTSGRDSYYTFASDFYEFDLFYPGKGYMWFYRYFQNLRNSGFRINGYLVPASIHSDILCMYIEYGMIFFAFYVFYIFFFLPYIINKKYSKNSSTVFLTLMFQLYLLYFTDNTSNYFITQSIFGVLPLFEYIKNKNCLISKHEKLC